MAQITLRSIAERIGCTRSTVSYALRDHPTISIDLRERIKKVATEMGWSPDAALRHQMALIRSTAQRADRPNLGIVLNRSTAEFTALPTLMQHLAGACERANELGFGFDIFRMHETPMSVKRLRDVMKARGIRGLIFVDIDQPSENEYIELATDFASVSVGCIPENSRFHTVTVDYMAMGRRMISELIKRGYRRPGIILPRGTEQLVRWSFTGGIHTGIILLAECDRIPIEYSGTETFFIPPEAFEYLRGWIAKNQPDVLVGIDTAGLRACFLPDKRFSKIPIFSLDWHPYEGAIGGIDQSSHSVGVVGIEMLVAQIDRGECGLPKIPRSINVRETWVMAKPGEDSLPKVKLPVQP